MIVVCLFPRGTEVIPQSVQCASRIKRFTVVQCCVELNTGLSVLPSLPLLVN